ncbi:MAG: VWA domain-containing protein [Myxococcales bacterium]
MTTSTGRFLNDAVTGTDPVSFALSFVAKLRERTDLSQVPSLRTAVAIPRFLTARYFRKRSLTARDYVEAAVYLTPYEDQGAAFEVARELLFPKEKSKEETPKEEVVEDAVVAPAPASASAKEEPKEASLLDDLAGLNLGDLGSLDLAALDQALEQKTAQAVELKAFDLFEQMATSGDAREQSMASLVSLFGGPAELEAEGAREREGILALLLERLRGRVGGLTPEEAFHASRSGLTDSVIEEARVPWERAGLLGAQGKDAVQPLLDEALMSGVAQELGKMLAFLGPHQKELGGAYKTFRTKALSSARHLSDWAQMLEGLGAFEPPPQALVASSAQENLPGALAAADLLERAFKGDGVSLKPTVFDAWADALQGEPTLDFLLDCCVPGERWAALVTAAFQREVVVAFAEARALPTDARAERIRSLLPVGKRLRETRTDCGKRLGSELATLALVSLEDKNRFLPLLDALVDAKLMPSDHAAVVAAGTKLGIAEEEIWARLSAPIEQLRFLIESRVSDPQRYQDLVAKLRECEIPPELLEELARRCLADGNLLGLALLLAVALGPVSQLMPQELVTRCLGHQGIGGGENLLRQWYEHRDAVHDELRERIKLIARHALLEAAFVWVHKGTGGATQGLVPQSRSRPYRAGDDIDNLDLEGTLDALVSSGKRPEDLGDEDLMVSDTTSGRAGFGVLIDVSGSMSGPQLAVCAIAVVMLLGRLKSEEVAIALFESDTHVIKRFAQARDLEEVADQLLEVKATGGTRVDQALRFMTEEFESEPECERRLLFLLSDFCFFEERRELTPLLDRLSDLNVGYLGAAHGDMDAKTSEHFARSLGGFTVKLSSMQRLPEVLLDALGAIGEGRLG